jgi:hypothetical protein
VIRWLNSDRWLGGDFEIIASGKRSIPPRRTMPDAPNPSSETIDKNEHLLHHRLRLALHHI